MPFQKLLLAGALLVGLVLGAFGVVLITDQPGLRTEYFALTPSWSGSPVYVEVTEPGIEARTAVSHVLVQQEIFSVRWRGWIDVPETGAYKFFAKADETSFVELDGNDVLVTEPTAGRRSGRARLELERGLHAIEIAFSQTGGPAELEVRWAPAGRGFGPLPIAALYAHRPVWPRKLARTALGNLPAPYRHAPGTVLILAALLLLAAATSPLRSRAAALGSRARRWAGNSPAVRRWLVAAFLAGLFGVTWYATAPYTTATVDGDDAAYMEAAVFGQKQPYIVNRYVHIYLLKALTWVRGGDVFLASRALWSLTFSVVVVSLAMAAKASGPLLQLKTLSVALFLLLSQPSIAGNVGASFADYSAMMFVTLGFGVYLLGRCSPPVGRHEWHALIIGALTVTAFRSKETGIILVWLLLLLPWTDGRLNLPRFARRLCYWLLGAAGAFALLMLVDWIVLGDFWFSVRPSTFADLGAANFKTAPEQPRTGSGWLHILWSGRGGQPDLPLRYVGLMVLASALTASLQRKAVELRLLHLMPVVYLLMMMALHVRGTYIFSLRYLAPIIPVACFLAASLLAYSGLEKLSLKDLLAPRALVLGTLAAALITLGVIPYQNGELTPAEFLPVTALGDMGWTPEDFTSSTVGPTLLLALLAAGAFWAGSRKARVFLLLIAALGFFGHDFANDAQSMAKHIRAQLGEVTLYPWRTFRTELRNASPERVVLSTNLRLQYRMGGRIPTRQSLGRVALGNRNLRVQEAQWVDSSVSHAIGTRQDLENWSRHLPGLTATATFDPAGRIVLVEPRAALDSTGALDAAGSS